MVARMNRFEDDDAHHLPPGMTRVGYDESTERYTFRHEDELWLGEPGSFYGGTMKWAGKAPATCSPSDDDETDDDSDTACTESSNDGTSLKKCASDDRDGIRTLPYLQESKNEWGVPIASISDTNAKPPDTTLGRRGTQFKKVAKSTVTAISVTRRWSRKKFITGSEDRRRSSEQQGENKDKNGLKLDMKSFAEKDLPILPVKD